jgi:enoyl-CoA hydratase
MKRMLGVAVQKIKRLADSSTILAVAEAELFLVELRGPAGVVTINRPEKLNAMTARFVTEMPQILARLARDPDVHGVVLTGAGRAFCVGGDMQAFLDVNDDAAESMRYLRLCMDCFAAVESAELPVLAAVNGLAFGGGAELTLACDLAIAADRARLPFVRRRSG